jgi:hypothetical protein
MLLGLFKQHAPPGQFLLSPININWSKKQLFKKEVAFQKVAQIFRQLCLCTYYTIKNQFLIYYLSTKSTIDEIVTKLLKRNDEIV